MTSLETVARAVCKEFYQSEWGDTSEFRRDICFGIAKAAVCALDDSIPDKQDAPLKASWAYYTKKWLKAVVDD